MLLNALLVSMIISSNTHLLHNLSPEDIEWMRTCWRDRLSSTEDEDYISRYGWMVQCFDAWSYLPSVDKETSHQLNLGYSKHFFTTMKTMSKFVKWKEQRREKEKKEEKIWGWYSDSIHDKTGEIYAYIDNLGKIVYVTAVSIGLEPINPYNKDIKDAKMIGQLTKYVGGSVFTKHRDSKSQRMEVL